VISARAKEEQMLRSEELLSLVIGAILMATGSGLAQDYILTPDERARAVAIIRGAPRPAVAPALGKEVVTEVIGVPSKGPAGATRRLAQITTYSYADDATVITTVNLDTGRVVNATVSKAITGSLAEEEAARAAELVRADPVLRARLGVQLALLDIEFLPTRAAIGSALAGRRLVRVLLKDEEGYIPDHPKVTVDLTQERVIVEGP
jgi:hypothetical protein